MIIEPFSKDHLPLAETKNRFVFGVLFIYLVVEITGILFHPMWRDEIHFWSISGASSSLKDLLHRKAWDGHPDLWYILVYAIRRLSDNPFSMQVMHIAIAGTTVFLILKYAPFSRGQRVLVIFGYFFMFEYSVISRNYSVGILLITIMLILHQRRARLLFVYALLFFLLAQTNIFSLILTLAFLMTWAFEFSFSAPFRNSLLRQKTVLIISIALVIIGIAYSLHTVMPPASGPHVRGTDFSLSQLTLKELIRSTGTIWRAWIPIPEITLQFWNTNIVNSDLIKAILSLILIFAAGTLFVKHPVVLFLYIVGLIGVISFIFLLFFGYLRHHGHLFILLIACLWLKSYYQERTMPLRFPVLQQFYGWMKRNFNMVFITLLTIHLFTGVFALTVQFLVPFSAGKETAAYIRQGHLDRYLIAGDHDVSLETVSSYLDKPAFSFSRKVFSTYLDYDPSQRSNPDEASILRMADSLVLINHDTLLLVMNYPLLTDRGKNLLKIKSFERSIVENEVYYLYLLAPNN
ncbi:MAG: hypothetical protein ACOYNC_18620 [Bacteroidales bacterium]